MVLVNIQNTNSFRNEMRSSRMYDPTKSFFMQCVSQLLVDQARLMWNDSVFSSSGLKGTLNLSVLYLTLLYRVELFSEVIETYRSLPTKNLTLCTLACAAAAKIGTKESFLIVSDLFWLDLQTNRHRLLHSLILILTTIQLNECFHLRQLKFLMIRKFSPMTWQKLREGA